MPRNTSGLDRWEAFLHICGFLEAYLDNRPSRSMRVTNWPLVINLASEHLVSTVLGISLRKSSMVPDPVRDYFEAVLSLNAERNTIIEKSVSSLFNALDCSNGGIIFLKGVPNLFEGLYPEPGARIISDVDILVHASRLTEVSQVLAELGYREMPTSPQSDRWFRPPAPPPTHHLPPLFHHETGLGIELHFALCSDSAIGLVPTEGAFQNAAKRSWRGAH